MNCRTFFPWVLAALAGFLLPARAADNVLITEFLAANSGPLADEDGDFSDWLEIHNAGANTVDLNGWFLTDRASQLDQWRFPATNLLPNACLIVFASGKDRRVPGAPLHTGFKLSSGGEYLALVRPDGTNVASDFGTRFPRQVSGVSFGISVQPMNTALIARGATARVFVPTTGPPDAMWKQPGFNDAAWTPVTTGVGFETDGLIPFAPVSLANSVTEFSGKQGQSNWFYGYWNKKSDANGIYADTEFVPFPNNGGAFGANNFWTGALWDWFGGNPPFTQLTADGGTPSGQNGQPARADHWAVRRYVNTANGPLTITGTITHTSDWVYVVATGQQVNPALYLYLLGAGEGYIDDLKLVVGAVAESGPNLLMNGGFESNSIAPWTVSDNLTNSRVTTAVKHSGAQSLHLVSSEAGETQDSAIWQETGATNDLQTYTLSYWYLPVTNSPPAVVRFSGSWIDTTPSPCGDGTVARIFVDGAEIFSQAAHVSAAAYSVTVPARPGSKVDFIIDAGAANDDQCDRTTFTAAIATADPAIVVVADSAADWSFGGDQGEKNWFYGYYNESLDTNTPGYQAGDFVPFPRDNGPYGANNFWNGRAWKWWNGEPPFDEIGQRIMNPNGLVLTNHVVNANGGFETNEVIASHPHWVIRRWISEVSGTILVDWTIAKPEELGAGVTARLLHNGVEQDVIRLPGISENAVARSVAIAGVRVGDAIDVALDPANPSGASVGNSGDRSLVTATIRGSPSLTSQIAGNLQNAMHNVNATACLRLPFNVANPSSIEFLTLHMKYDDGFIAYLNGQEVARANAPMLPAWNSAATASRPDADAVVFEEFNLTAARGLLQAGANVLAIHGLNARAGDSDFLVLPELIATSVTLAPSSPRYFIAPTPGAANGYGTTNVGPLIASAAHSPNVPRDDESLLVTAQVLPTFNPVGSVRLIYRVMFGNEVTAAMFDDGQHGDGAADDGVFGGLIPAGASQPGQMVRYATEATDNQDNSARFPAYGDPLNSPQYQGTVVFDPAATNRLPVFQFFAQDTEAVTNTTGTRCSVFYDDEFFDNVAVNVHGQTTPSVFAKRGMNFDFNPGHDFRWDRREARVNDVILMSTASDKAHLRTVLAMESFRDMGVPSFFARPIRVQQNGGFHGVMHLIEQGDGRFLQRHGLDPEGAFYKIYRELTNAYAGTAEKKTRRQEHNADLQALIDGCRLSGAARRQFLYDNLDLPEFINYLATLQVVQSEDCCESKNYYLYRDSNGTKEWQMIPWDVDLTFGRAFVEWSVSGNHGGYYDTNLYYTNIYYWQTRSDRDYIGRYNTIVEALWDTPEIFEMFLRRWGRVQEQLLQPPATPAALLKYERRVDDLAAQIAPDAALDFAQWAPYNPPAFLPEQTLPDAVALLKTYYFPRRRNYVFNTLRYAKDGPYLGPQPANAALRFGAIETNPSSASQAQEYIQIINPNAYAVDLSGWRIASDIEHTFKPGTVLPARGALYLSPDVTAFRARASGPRGGQGLFVQGNYKGRLSARGASLRLVTDTGRDVATTNFSGAPSLAQQYLRVTEIMYHPAAPPPGLSTNADEFEYLELKNLGPFALNLLGVRFVNGVVFDFTNAAITNLAPGQTVLVVRNLDAFASRYGGGLPVAGQYFGALDNQGENLRLEDARGEVILDFAYDNQWYPMTDGNGFSLVIADENADWRAWGLKTSWRASGRVGGSPDGSRDLPPRPPRPIVINELLTHTNTPAARAIEFSDPAGSSVNPSGWYLSDDFRDPRKFRVPQSVGGSHPVLTETDFASAVSLNPSGGEIWIFSADESGELSGYFHGFEYGAAESGVTFGRHVNSVGEEQFVAQTAPTLGGANAGPRVGPVVISEIHFHPPDFTDGTDNSDDEFIELQNVTASAVPLFHPALTTNTWRLRGNVDFDFPTNVTLAAAGFGLLVNFDPADAARLADFRARFSVPGGVPVFGPFAGKLDNASGELKLTQPGTPLAGDVPRVVVDRVKYSDGDPWPTNADGSGLSLQRLVAAQFGNDPANWRAAVPTLGAQTVNCIDTLAPAVASFKAAGRTTNIAATAANACAWTVGNTNAWITVLSATNGVGSGLISYRVATNLSNMARSGSLVIGGRPHLVAQSGVESVLPVVAITAPAANARLFADLVTVSGTSRDNFAVRRVEYQIGSNVFPAIGPTNWATWSFDLPLASGTNTVRVWAVDLAGNVSPALTRSVFRVVTNQLSVTTSPVGLGSVTPALNGKFLEIGRGYAVTATPPTGYLFSNWISSLAGVAGRLPALNFLMQPGLALTANFVPNPFIPTKGSYNGLCSTPGEARHESAGAFNLTVTDRGAYSGKLTLGGKPFTFSGQFDLDGRATNRVGLTTTNRVHIEWQLALTPGVDAMGGRVTNGVWEAALAGARVWFHAVTNKATNFTGKYTLAIPGVPDPAQGPQGDSYATAFIDLAGNVNVSGALADNTPFTLKAPLTKEGYWPLYLPLYAGKGSLWAWVTMTNALDLSASVNWSRPPLPTAPYYRLGFATNIFDLAGSRFTPPSPLTNSLLNFAAGRVEFSDGNLFPPVTNTVTVLPNNKLTNHGPGAMTMTLTATNGAFGGTATLPGLPKPVPFKGVLLPTNQLRPHIIGRGFFLGTNQSGRVYFEPISP